MKLRALSLAVLLGLAASAACHGATFSIGGGTKYIFLQVGTGTTLADNTAVNKMSLTVPGAQNGRGTALTFTSNSTATGPYTPGTLTCTLPNQVYITVRQRRPSSGTATFTVTSPTTLTSGTRTIPISTISWTTDGSTGIPAGTFSGGTQSLTTVSTNQGVENCLTFRYANNTVVPSGTFTATVTYTAISP